MFPGVFLTVCGVVLVAHPYLPDLALIRTDINILRWCVSYFLDSWTVTRTTAIHACSHILTHSHLGLGDYYKLAF